MKQVFCALIFMLPFVAIAQKKNCKFLKSTNKATGKTLQMIAAPSKIGNFYLAKDGDSLVVSYARKAAMALLDNSNTNTVYLSIDSVMLSYDDNTRRVFKAVGSGTVANNTYALKPEFIHVEFGLQVPKNEQDFILTKTPNGIKVFGEKGAQYFDILNEKHQEKFKTACGCLTTP